MTWKMPVPTDLNRFFGNDTLALLVFERLLIRARIQDETVDFASSPTFLMRGQSVCGYRELAKMYKRDWKTIKRCLYKLQNKYMRVVLRPTPKGTVVTIKNFDEVIKMEVGAEHNRVPNKIVKNNKLYKTAPYKEDSCITERKIDVWKKTTT